MSILVKGDNVSGGQWLMGGLGWFGIISVYQSIMIYFQGERGKKGREGKNGSPGLKVVCI